jgi:hypothetical protein
MLRRICCDWNKKKNLKRFIFIQLLTFACMETVKNTETCLSHFFIFASLSLSLDLSFSLRPLLPQNIHNVFSVTSPSLPLFHRNRSFLILRSLCSFRNIRGRG